MIGRISSSEFESYIRRNSLRFNQLSAEQDKVLANMLKDLAISAGNKINFAKNRLDLSQRLNVINEILRTLSKFTANFTKYIEKSIFDSAGLGNEINMVINEQLGRALADKGLNINMNSDSIFKVPENAVKATFDRYWKDGMRLSDRIWNMERNAEKFIQDTIMEEIITGVPATDKDLIDKLTQYMNLDAQSQIMKKAIHGKKLCYSAVRLLRTERTIAFREAQKQGALKCPGIIGIKWNRGSNCNCDICHTLAIQDLYGLGAGVYEVTEYPQHPHPQCMCFTTEITESIESFTKRWQEFMAEPKSHPDLHRWFVGQYGGKLEDLVNLPARHKLPTVAKPKDVVTKKTVDIKNVNVSNAKTLKEAEEWAKKNLGIEADYSKFDVTMANRANNALAPLVKEWKHTTKKITAMPDARRYPNAYAYSHYFDIQKTEDRFYKRGIFMKPSYCKKNSDMNITYANDLRHGFHPAPKYANEAFEDTITHEFAHNILTDKFYYIDSLDETDRVRQCYTKIERVKEKYKEEIRKLRDIYLSKNPDAYGVRPDFYLQDDVKIVHISGYANEDTDEFIAECFCQYYRGENVSQYADETIGILKEYFKK